MVKTHFLTGLIFVLLSGCASIATQPTSEPAKKAHKDSFSQFERDKEEAPSSRSSGGIDRLLERAQNAEQEGDYDKATSIVERALRIRPQNATLWYRLSRLYYLKSDYQKAIQFARRSNSFAGQDMAQREQNSILIRNSEEAMFGRN